MQNGRLQVNYNNIYNYVTNKQVKHNNINSTGK